MKRFAILLALVVVAAAIYVVTASAAIVDSGNDGCKVYHAGIHQPVFVNCGDD
jgi:hypothetical protein